MKRKKKKKVVDPLAAWRSRPKLQSPVKPPKLPATPPPVPSFLGAPRNKPEKEKDLALKADPIPAARKVKKPRDFYHILIVHGKQKGTVGFPWVHFCLSAVKRYTKSPHRIYLFNWCGTSFPGVKIMRPGSHFKQWCRKYSMHKKYIGWQHQSALTYMAERIRDGWLVTLDTDAFPLESGWEKRISKMAGPNGICGLGRRLLKYPKLEKVAHPSCLVMPAQMYPQLGTTFFGTGSKGDVGVRITKAARKQKRKVVLIKRTNRFKGLDKLGGGGSSYFAVHDFIYHHSCGSRMAKRGAVATSGTHSWPKWVLQLDAEIKKRLKTNFESFKSFVEKGRK